MCSNFVQSGRCDLLIPLCKTSDDTHFGYDTAGSYIQRRTYCSYDSAYQDDPIGAFALAIEIPFQRPRLVGLRPAEPADGCARGQISVAARKGVQRAAQKSSRAIPVSEGSFVAWLFCRCALRGTVERKRLDS
jgi:hypothetical protein